MSEMVERVAQAIARAQGEAVQNRHRAQATSAIRAMRDLSEPMHVAMIRTPMPSEVDPRPLYEAIWQRGVDAALREP